MTQEQITEKIMSLSEELRTICIVNEMPLISMVVTPDGNCHMTAYGNGDDLANLIASSLVANGTAIPHFEMGVLAATHALGNG